MKYTYSKNYSKAHHDRNMLVRIWLAWENLVGKVLSPLFANKADHNEDRQDIKKSFSDDPFSFIGMLSLFKRRRFLFLSLVFILILGFTAFLSLKYLTPAEATQWWPDGGSSWKHRKQLTVTNNSAANLSSGTTVAVTINTSALVSAAKLQSDCDDLRILYQPNSTTVTEATRHLIFPSGTTCSTSTTTKVYFKLQAALNTGISTSDYFVYYGNGSASTPSSTDDAFDVSSANATLICPFDGSTTCAAGEVPSTESGAIRYSGNKSALSFRGGKSASSMESVSSTASGLNNLPYGDMTVEFWSYYSILEGSDTPIGKRTGWYIYYSNNNVYYYNGCTSSQATTTSNNPNTYRTWNHIAVTWNASTGIARIFVNGTEASYSAQPSCSGGYANDSAQTFRVGRDNEVFQAFPGKIDEVRISNMIRYTSNFTPQTSPFIRDSNTKLLWHFDENDSDPRNAGKAIDDSGNGYHGTINSAKYVAGIVGIDSSTSETGNVFRQTYAGHEGIFVEEGTTNKITDPSFENAAYNTVWGSSGANLTPSINTTYPYYKYGTQSGNFIASATAISGTSNMETIGIDPDSTATHTLTFYAFNNTSGDEAGIVSSSIVKPVWEGTAQAGGTYTNMGGGWWRVTYSAATADSLNQYGFEVQVSKRVYIDGVQLEQKSYATTYTDGTLGAGYSWNGTSHQSTSSRTVENLQYATSGNITASTGTISLWAKSAPAIASIVNDHYLFDIKQDASNRIALYVDDSTDDITLNTNGTETSSVGITMAANTWQHFVITWDFSADQYKVYQNGNATPIISTTTSLTTPTLPTNIVIGADGDNANNLNGIISDFKIFGNILSSTDVSDLYYAGLVAHSQGTETIRGTTPDTKGEAPVALWHMDEGYGTTTHDSTTNANDLTISGATWNKDAALSQNPRATVLKFDGSNDYAYRTTDGDFDFGTGSFTITGSFRHPSTISGTDTILARYGSAGYKVYMNSSGYICAGLDYDSTWTPTDSACSTTSYADSRWHTFTVVKSGTTSLTLYIDGIQAAQDASLTASSINTGSSIYLGIDSDASSNPWDGFLDEVAVYSYAFTVGQVKTSFGGTQAGAVMGAQIKDSLGDGLVGYWKMDETATPSIDSSGNNISATWTNNQTYSSGKYANGAELDGDGDYAEASDNSSLDITGPLTLSAWINPDVVSGGLGGGSGNVGIIAKYRSQTGATNQRSYQIGIDTSTSLLYSAISSDGTSNTLKQTTSMSTLSANTWQHVVMSYSPGKEIRLYINGTLDKIDTSSVPTSIANTDAPLWIGQQFDSTNNNLSFDGTIDEARVYNRALSSSEVQQLYNFASGPVGHWKMDEGTGQNPYDTSGNNFTTVLGSTTSSEAIDPTWTTGKYGKGLSFDGSNDYVQITSTSGDKLDLTNNMSVETWFKFSAVHDTNNYLFSRRSSGTGYGYSLYVNNTSDTLRALITTASGNCGDTTLESQTLTTNTWYHGGFSYDGATMRLFVNGVEVDSVVCTYSAPSQTVNALLGIYNSLDAQYVWTGTIDDTRVYNYARTAKQIVEDMNADHPAGGSPVGSAVGYWKFDEGADGLCSGGVNDVCNSGSGGSTLDGAQTSMAVPAISTSGWTSAGKFGKGLMFDGTSDRIDVADSPSLEANTISVSAWVYITGTTGDYQVVAIKGSTDYEMSLTNSLNPRFGITNSSNSRVVYNSTKTLSQNTWYHLAMTYDGTTIKNYINGQFDTSQPQTGNIRNSATGLAIGYYSNAYWLKGTIDEIKIYNFALSPAEILIDYNRGSSAVMGALSDKSTYDKNAANQEYCVPGDSTSCAAPIAEWKMDERTGQYTYDTSGNNKTGTLGSSSGADSNDPTWSSGKIGQALNFDGSNDYVDVGDQFDFNRADTRTFSAWIKADTLASGSNSNSILAKEDMASPYDGWSFDLVSSGKLRFSYIQSYPSSALIVESSTAQIATGRWYHVTAVYNSASISFYVNGASVATTTIINAGSNNIDNALSLNIGNRDNDSNNGGLLGEFDGLIDHVRIYNYARTPAQIAWDYNRGGPVAHYKLDECSGATAYDASGNGINATIYPVSNDNTSVGTCSSGISTEMWNDGTNGKFNASIALDGNDDYVSATSTNMTGSSSVTEESFSLWVKPSTTLSSSQGILNDGDSSKDNVPQRLIQSNNTGQVRVLPCNAAYSSYTTNRLSTGNWTHIVWTRTGTTNKIYIDGTLDVTSTISATCTMGPNLYIGVGYNANFPGQIDDVRIYNYALTANQVKNIMNEGSAVRFGPITGQP